MDSWANSGLLQAFSLPLQVHAELLLLFKGTLKLLDSDIENIFRVKKTVSLIN